MTLTWGCAVLTAIFYFIGFGTGWVFGYEPKKRRKKGSTRSKRVPPLVEGPRKGGRNIVRDDFVRPPPPGPITAAAEVNDMEPDKDEIITALREHIRKLKDKKS